jgi:diaminopimelate epimerase
MPKTKNTIPFYKMSGSGNDFIIIDNRQPKFDEADLTRLIVGACRRKMSAGADGLILVEDAQGVDFKWRFYNSDGSRAEMCGNGARCVSRFACLEGIAGKTLSFRTDAGPISAVVSDKKVKIKMTDPTDLGDEAFLDLEDTALAYRAVNTGVPHSVIEVEGLEGVDVVTVGREVRNHPAFAPNGTNANFIQLEDDGTLSIRTYERGVEDETLACGTGNVAAALVASLKHGLQSPVKLLTRSGEYLSIYFEKKGSLFSEVYLEGDARVIYKGELYPEAWQ